MGENNTKQHHTEIGTDKVWIGLIKEEEQREVINITKEGSVSLLPTLSALRSLSSLSQSWISLIINFSLALSSNLGSRTLSEVWKEHTSDTLHAGKKESRIIEMNNSWKKWS